VIDLVNGKASITGNVSAHLVFVDGKTVGGATEQSLKVRRNLAEEGVVTIVAIVNPDSGKIVENPDFLAHGFEMDHTTFESAVPVIQRVLTKASKEGIDIEQTEELVSQAVSTWAFRKYRRSPLIIPVIIDA
jgi:ribonuclease J